MSKEKEGKAEERRNWSELPPELLNLIGRRIIKVKDAIRFRVVCKTWWETLAEQQPLQFHQSSALLMLPYCSHNEQGNGAGDNSCCRLFMDVARSQYHHLDFEQALKQANCRGSAFGWLFMLQRIPVLFNPLTGGQISLPPLTTFPEVLGYFPETVGAEYLIVDHDYGGLLFAVGKKYVESIYIDRIAMSAEPNAAEGCVLMATCWVLSKRRLAFCRPGGDKWTLLPYLSVGGGPVHYQNIVFWRNKFYAIDNYNRILICDLAVPNVSFLAPKVRLLPADFDTRYLVVGLADELMLVGRSLAEREEDAVGALNEQHDAGREEDAGGRVIPAHIEDDRHEVDDQSVRYVWDSDTDDECECCPNYETIKFTVYKLNEETNQWGEIKSIGDYALFLGMNTSACLSTQDHSGYKPDCIYFTDDSFEKHVRRRRGGYDMGIYHLSDGTIESLCCINLYENPSLVWPPPVWVSPAIN
ncbi:unnamed protein product [Linum trigynum]|uniref:KIB1-4 beta-propeller domain-containing protein n=1 Tax=Linum trigynum TaxID=586398 RepID=A0AAV2EKQ5_9ROSI